jgi:hypothetical protein
MKFGKNATAQPTAREGWFARTALGWVNSRLLM